MKTDGINWERRVVLAVKYLDFKDRGGEQVTMLQIWLSTDRPYQDIARGMNGLFPTKVDADPSLARGLLQERLPAVCDLDVMTIPGTGSKEVKRVMDYKRVGDVTLEREPEKVTPK